MTTYRIKTPDGKSYRVEAPDPAAAAKAVKSMLAKTGGTSASAISTGEDVVRSALTGLGEGATQSVGLLGDVSNLADQFGTWVGDQFGLKRLTPEQQARLDNPFGMPDIRPPTTAAIEQATGFDQVKHEPQTTAGKFARTGASFAGPGLVSGTIGAGVRTGVKTALEQGIKTGAKTGAAGLGSEAAGQATEGTIAEPFARVGGALIGGKLAAGRKARPPPAPVKDELKTEAGALYDSAKQRGVLVSHTALDPAIDDMTRKVQAFGGFDPQLTPDTYRVVQRLHNEFRGTSADIEDLGKIREIIGTAAGAVRKEDRKAAMILKDAFDDFTTKLKPADVLAGDPQAAMNDIIKARSLWSRMSKAETIEQVFERAKNAVGANYTAAGMQTALRQQFKQIANNPRRLRQFSTEEQDAIKGIIRGSSTENFLRLVGKLAPRGTIGTGLIGGMIYVDPATGVAAWLAGEGAKALSTRIGLKKVNALDDMVRRGGKPPVPPKSTLPAVVAPWYGAKELQREADRRVKRDRNGVPILDERGRYIPAP